MGLFKGREIYTASVSYNLGGEYEGRTEFLKSLVAGNVFRPDPDGLGSRIRTGLMNGPGMRLRSFQRWALNNYGAIGVPGEVKLTVRTVLRNTIAAQIGGFISTVQGIEVGLANYSYWAEQHIMENYSSLLNTLWRSDISEDDGSITITFEDETTTNFTPTDFDPSATYIYATYYDQLAQAPKLYIYRMGSGINPVLETLVEEDEDGEALFPVIPIRIRGQFLSSTYMSSAYDLAKKALKKSIGADMDELIEKLEQENQEGIDDIDYAYVTFGAALNSPSPEAKTYMWHFFEEMRKTDEINAADLDEWVTKWSVTVEEQNLWQSWENAPPDATETPTDPQPTHTAPPGRPYQGIMVRSPGSIDINYDVRIEWSAIEKSTGSGLARPEAKPGDVWWNIEDADEYTFTFGNIEIGGQKADRVNNLILYRQVSETEWEALTIRGLVQKTYVFGNHFGELHADEAILSAEADEECPFIIPLKMSVFKKMPLKDQTEFAGSCAYLTLHAYEIVIQRWYQTILLQIIIIAAVIAITAMTGGLGASSVGVLGSNLAVGTALGLAGSTAVLIGAAVNMLAAMAISSIITRAATEVFGAELGALIGTLVSIATINGLTNMASTGSFALNFGDLTQASNLLKMTNSVVGGYTNYINAKTEGYIQDTQNLLEDYEEESERIDSLYTETFGYGNTLVDPMLLVDATNYLVESPSVFLTRTLMTGSDIAELSIDSLSNFADISLSVTLPLQ